MKTTTLIAALVLATACGALSQRAQDPPAEVPSYTILQARGTITIDGLLDEADWEQAPTIDFIFPWDDVSKVPPQSTVARMLWDRQNLIALS